MKRTLGKCIIIGFVVTALAGCTFVFQKGRRSDLEKIEDLSRQVDELSEAKRLLEDRLSQEIQDDQVKMRMTDRGLVITVVADLLFDSGKAKIRTEAYPLLEKVARVLKENVANNKVGIEGHTDNQPIKHSGWKSNWELSSSRALAVLHYLAEEQKLDPERLSANGYGEFQPVSSNATKRGRQLNRRVEIVIYPQVTKVKGGSDAPAAEEDAVQPDLK
jgi:chemotaxis protein MotB